MGIVNFVLYSKLRQLYYISQFTKNLWPYTENHLKFYNNTNYK